MEGGKLFLEILLQLDPRYDFIILSGKRITAESFYVKLSAIEAATPNAVPNSTL